MGGLIPGELWSLGVREVTSPQEAERLRHERQGPLGSHDRSVPFPISRGNRRRDIKDALAFFLPRVLNSLFGELRSAIEDELLRLQYLEAKKVPGSQKGTGSLLRLWMCEEWCQA